MTPAINKILKALDEGKWPVRASGLHSAAKGLVVSNVIRHAPKKMPPIVIARPLLAAKSGTPE